MILIFLEAEDPIVNADDENVSGGGPNDERNASQECSFNDLTQMATRTILVRDSISLSSCIENLQSNISKGPAGTAGNIAGQGAPSDVHVPR